MTSCRATASRRLRSARYRGLYSQIEVIEQTGPRSVRISFKGNDRELALIAGLRPILKKAQWADKAFADSGLTDVPIGTGAYIVDDFEAGRHVSFKRNPDYWGKDLPFRRGTQNFDEMRVEFYGDGTVLFEAFKAGELTAIREFNAELFDDWIGARFQSRSTEKIGSRRSRGGSLCRQLRRHSENVFC